MSHRPPQLGRHRGVRAALATVAATALLLTTAACSSSSEKSDAASTLVVGIVSPGDQVEPNQSSSKSGGYVQKPVLPGLMSRADDGTLKPELATSWKSNDTGDVWTITLRDGVTWADGSEFDADDVIATLETALNPDHYAPGASGYKGILSQGHYTAIDDHTIEFDLDRPYADFPYVIAYGPLTFLPSDYTAGTFTDGGANGIGAFNLVSFDAEVGATYKKNPDYWNADEISIDTLEIRFYGDDQAMALAVQSGEVDMLPIIGNSAAAALTGSDDLDLMYSSSSSYYSLRMQTDVAPFDDVRVRQALALAIDRQAIIDTLYDGNADIGNDTPFAPAFPQSAAVIEEVPQREQDIEQAKELLAEAGYPDGIDLTVTSENYADIPDFLQLVKSQVAEAGINLTIDLMSQSDYYGTDGDEPWLEVALGSTDWGERSTPSQAITPAYLTDAAFNESHYSSSAFDEAMAKYDAATDEAERDAYAVEAATILNEDVPAIIAFFPKQVRVVSSKVHGVAAGPASQLNLTGVTIDE